MTETIIKNEYNQPQESAPVKSHEPLEFPTLTKEQISQFSADGQLAARLSLKKESKTLDKKVHAVPQKPLIPEYYIDDSAQFHTYTSSKDDEYNQDDLENIIESDHPWSFSIVGPVGKGGYGSVYHAKLTGSSDDVAVKYGDVNKEILVQNLDHDNITRILGQGSDENGQYIVREFVKGKSLQEIFDSGEKMELRKAGSIAAQIVAGIDYLHGNNIIHGDLKPANILVPDDWENESVKITDFGLSRTVDGVVQSMETKTSAIKGTFDYMAPELVYQRKKSTKESDAYSFGVLLIQLFTGEKINAFDDERFERDYALNEALQVYPARMSYKRNNDGKEFSWEEAKIADTVIHLRSYLSSNSNKRPRVIDTHAILDKYIFAYVVHEKLKWHIDKIEQELMQKRIRELHPVPAQETHAKSIDAIVADDREIFARIKEELRHQPKVKSYKKMFAWGKRWGSIVLGAAVPGYVPYKVWKGPAWILAPNCAFIDVAVTGCSVLASAAAAPVENVLAVYAVRTAIMSIINWLAEKDGSNPSQKDCCGNY